MSPKKQPSAARDTGGKASGKDAAGGYLSTIAAARLCGVSIFSIQRWFDAGLLTGAKLPGGRRRISTASLEQFMRKHVIAPQQGESPDAMRVLVVDDDAKLLNAIRDGLLQAGGYVVRTASTGMEAGLAIAEFHPDCVVLDVMMEDLPGASIVRRIKESQAGRGCRIVAISGRASEASIKEITDAGANAYLRKPFTMADLFKAISAKRSART